MLVHLNLNSSDFMGSDKCSPYTKIPMNQDLFDFCAWENTIPLYTAVIFEDTGNQVNDYFEILKLIILN